MGIASNSSGTSGSSASGSLAANDLFQKSLGLREDGHCQRHPEVVVWEAGAPSLRSCSLCAKEMKPKDLNDTSATLESSYFWTSAASLSCNSPAKSKNSSKSSPFKNEAHPSQQQSASEENSERRQEKEMLESILMRWMQVQVDALPISSSAINGATQEESDSGLVRNLPHSLLFAVPMILQELRHLHVVVEQQQAKIAEQSKTITELRNTVEQTNGRTQDLLQTILQTVNASATAAAAAAGNTTASSSEVKISSGRHSGGSGKKKNQTMVSGMELVKSHQQKKIDEEKLFSLQHNNHQRGKPKRYNSKTSMQSSAMRSVDNSVKQPVPRHDGSSVVNYQRVTASVSASSKAMKDESHNSMTMDDLQLQIETPRVANSNNKKKTKADGAKTSIPDPNLSNSQPIEYSQPLPAEEMDLLRSSSSSKMNYGGVAAEIALDGSHHSFERQDLPNVDMIFEDGMGDTLPKEWKNKIRIPKGYKKKARVAANHAGGAPMEIILEKPVGGNEPAAVTGKTNKKENGHPQVTPTNDASKRNNAEKEDGKDSRKLIPTSPEEVGLAFDDNERLHDSLQAIEKAKKNQEKAAAKAKAKAKQKKEEEILGVGKISVLTLGAGSPPSNDSDLSDSDHEDDDDDDDDDVDDNRAHHKFDFEDLEPNDYEIDDLQHVSRYKMIDMYGDRGTYTGTLGADQEPTGFGTMKYDSGRFYKGEWKQGRWNGKGTLLNANGDSYQGDFVSDARHGKGVYRFTSGDVYEGDFFEDNRHGKGKFKFHNGSVYNGDFYMGSFEGYGRYDFDGGYYEGQWKRDEYYGKGKLQYKDGSNYQGRFKRGSAHGFGEERLADGTIRCGLWKRGEFIQECTEEECNKRGGGSSSGLLGSSNRSGQSHKKQVALDNDQKQQATAAC